MTRRAKALWIALSFAIILPMCGFAPGPANTLKNDFIVTAAAEYKPLAALKGEERFPKGAQLLRVHEGKTEPLVTGFAASADASVSFDGAMVLFAGKKEASDPWQIWEFTLADGSARRVTDGSTDSIRPLYLPAGRFVYAKRTAQGFEIVSARIDGSPAPDETGPSGTKGESPITFSGASAIPADVLADGRILFEANFPLGHGTTPEQFLVYSDGSGVESYRCDHGITRWGGKQLASGDVVFTHGASLARFTSPLAHEQRVAAPVGEYTGQIAETESGAWLMSTRSGPSAHYAIKKWRPGTAAMEAVVAQSGVDLVEPVLLAARTRPHRHPSGLHPWDYANLLALDARISRDGALKGTPATVRLETQDAAGNAVSLGSAPVEQDGSFFVKVPGDRPVRFALLDGQGRVLRQEHGWFWARGGEQRYCVGCHAGPERAPENRVPQVLLQTTDPVDLTGAHSANAARQIAAGSR